jgi:hypothetical protein
MKLDQATKNFALALSDLIAATIAGDEAQVTEPTEVKEVKGAKADKWPKSFSVWFKTLPESDQASATGQLLKNCSCTHWACDTIKLIVMPTQLSGSAAISEEDIQDVKDLLGSELGFNGDLTIMPSSNLGAQAEKKTTRTKKAESMAQPETPEITPEQLKQECLALAQRLGNRDIVLGILKKFGASKIDEIAKDKYPTVLNAVKNYQETTTAAGVDANEF